ncbi:hypothetical protein L1887_14355 [Cichorium endivia]|nr:hypothetical protein L1887_14355 [Cichorium endivia]
MKRKLVAELTAAKLKVEKEKQCLWKKIFSSRDEGKTCLAQQPKEMKGKLAAELSAAKVKVEEEKTMALEQSNVEAAAKVVVDDKTKKEELWLEAKTKRKTEEH